MNKIKNFISNTKSAVSAKSTELFCKAKSALTNEAGEFYIDKTVGIIIAVVVGVLLMGIIYTFINTNIETKLNSEIAGLWGYTGA